MHCINGWVEWVRMMVAAVEGIALPGIIDRLSVELSGFVIGHQASSTPLCSAQRLLPEAPNQIPQVFETMAIDQGGTLLQIEPVYHSGNKSACHP